MPKDAELTELFRSHRDAFEKLAAIGVEDTNTTTYLNLETLNEEPLTDGRQALSPARRSEYRELIASIRPDLAVSIDWYRITFSYWRGGDWLPIGRTWMKRIAYLPHGYERVGTIVSNSDKVPQQTVSTWFPSSQNHHGEAQSLRDCIPVLHSCQTGLATS
jgi:hypothetical protein